LPLSAAKAGTAIPITSVSATIVATILVHKLFFITLPHLMSIVTLIIYLFAKKDNRIVKKYMLMLLFCFIAKAQILQKVSDGTGNPSPTM
jgi:Ca2+/Na+ antiporter